ncbi:E3 ubiquitin-protein ligase TRIM33-like [Uloborus diversus]|uniref:E3 ubiquitin-protein ligase TRIM33-like n=1 Tax=Uloborus diversus TaxID=327109 RepID=UPI0024093279|nr:E3 ubiquitin-protein ligase TRIM33-like [Uloborus diversus]
MEVDPSSSPNNIDESTTDENPGENSNSGSTEQVTESGTSEYSELWMDFKCVFCNQDLKSIAHPKLLPCLHTACDSCLISESNGESGASSSAGNRQLNCAACNQDINSEETVDHLFLTEYVQNSEAQPEESSYPCTSCEEGAEGSAFCQNCQEWLCDTCVNAHHRVRVTKDHVVRPKDEMEGETAALRNQKYLICPIHSPEQLKLYCETCDKLTCRDCQLSDHKEHKYQFLAKACEEEKGNITELLTQIKEKQGHIENASNNLNRRHEEIEDREKVVTQEIKTFSVKFITDINKRGKALLQELNKVCSEKKNQLNFKNKELRTIAERLKHCQKFAHAAVTLGSETALVYSKKPIMNQLRRILRHRCEVPNPNHMVDIQFNYETSFLTQYISSLGQILVDSHPLPGSSANQNAMLPMPQNMSQSPIPSTPTPPMRQVSHVQMNPQRNVPIPVQQMNQQLGPYGQPQVTSSTDLARTPNNPQMRQVLTNSKMVNYNQNHMQPRARVQQSPQANYTMQANQGYTPRHVMHQQQPQAQIRQHPQVQQQQQQQQQQQVSMQRVQERQQVQVQQVQVQQQNYTQQNTPNQLPMPLRQNKSISVTALPSPSGPSPSKQRAIAPRASMNISTMNNQNNLQHINSTQASPHRPQGPQVIVIDDQPNQKTPNMSNTSRLSHFPSSIAATIAANPQLQIQPANYNNSRHGRGNS